MHTGITSTNILLNIELEFKATWKTQEELSDKWKATANKYLCKITYFNQYYIFDYWMGAGLKRMPSVKDVLYSFIMDDVHNMSFKDFCNCFGYDNDSIKALETYKLCEKQTEAYYKMFDYEERELLQELLQDY